jgi:short-subunit dehydrogenase
MAAQPSRPIALVTGASWGIGAGFAEHLARAGYDLVLVARRREVLDELAGRLSTEHGASAEVIAADLATDAGVTAVADRIGRGDIDLLVNNAGFGTSGEFAELPLARELEEVDLNMRAVVRLSHAALRPMLARGRGGIINVASTGAFQPVPYMATYAATKAFVLSFSEALHEETKGRGVTVTCVCPGPVRTAFQETAAIDSERLPGWGWTTVDAVVRSALSAWKHGRALAIPGALNRATAVSATYSPRFLTRKIAGAMFRNARKEQAQTPTNGQQ